MDQKSVMYGQSSHRHLRCLAVWLIQGDQKRLWIVISLWRTWKLRKMSKLFRNDIQCGFDILMSQKRKVKNSCLLGLGQNSELAPVWANPSWSESPKTLPSSSGIPKISPRSIDTSRHPKTKKTQTDTNRHCQMSSNTPRQPSDTPKMHDRARLEPF